MNDMSSDMLAEARGHFINGNYKMSEPILQQLLLQNTRNPEIYQMLATIYYDKGQFNKAIKTFKRALEIDPTYTDASVGLSIILNDLGRYDEGKEVFHKAKELLDSKNTGNDPFINEKLAAKHEELGDLYFQYKRYSEALEQLLKAQRLSGRRAEITLRIAEVYVQMNQTEKAIKDLKNLIREFPQLIPARIKLGVIYYNLNRVAEATEQWESVLIRDPQHPEALRLLKMANAAGITVEF
ncbi:MAG TPA: tetratricopeptide repeat protein [Pseudobdellovibrionaceae bacterium]|nr:tetratricopeptide repeat protein [Pseudobdellovibrionaceae bacterium]